jgi:two-component system, cell cycle sensor histidine kinase and response regulator CckA
MPSQSIVKPDARGPGRQVNVLVAEDSPTQAAQLIFLLEERGFHVTHARNGRLGLDLAKAQRPDLIISDIVMPEMDGYEFCRAVKSDSSLRGVPVILVTSLSSPHDVFRGLDAGADNFIVKPYEEGNLLSRIAYLLSNQELRKTGNLQVGIEIELSGQRHFITAERQQILDLLISTYEQAMHLYEVLDARQAELSRSYATLNALYDVAIGLNRCRSESDVAITAIERGLGLPGVRAAWIYLLDGTSFRLAAAGGAAYGVITQDSSDAPCKCQGQLLAGAMSGAVNVVDCRCMAPLAGAHGARHHASVALSAGSEAIGLLNLVGTDDRLLSDDELRTLSGFGSQVAAALERARLHEDLERKVAARTRELQSEVAERRQAEAAAKAAGLEFRRAKDTLSAILDASPAAIMTLDRDRRVLTWNRAAMTIFGYATEDVIGQEYPLLPAGQRHEHDAFFAELAAGKPVEAAETKCRRSDGKTIDVRLSGMPLYDEHGVFSGGVFALEDTSERKRVEDQLRQAQKMDAIGNLSGGIAHDFNNMLAVIVGNLDLLSEELGEAHAAGEYVVQSLTAAERGAELVRRLLAFSRRQSLDPTTLDPNKVIESLSPLLGRALGETVGVELSLDAAIGRIHADRNQLENALLNLAINARDAMPNGGRIAISTQVASIDADTSPMFPDLQFGEYVTIGVTDSGTGIPLDVLPHVFEPFFTTKPEGQGTGLGLSMVYGYMRQSGGAAKIYSELGHGTTVWLYFPVSAAGPDAAVPIAPEALPAPTGDETILVVEDRDDVRLVAIKMLTRLGYKTVIARDATEALAMIERGDAIHVLFTDVVMPGAMSGMDLAQEIRRQGHAVPVLLTSGYATPHTLRSQAQLAGLQVISKPYRASELAVAIRAALNG